MSFKIKKTTKDLKFVSTNISVFFLRPFSKYTKTLYILYLQYYLKTVTMVNIRTLKHYEKLAHSQKQNKTTCKKCNG